MLGLKCWDRLHKNILCINVFIPQCHYYLAVSAFTMYDNTIVTNTFPYAHRYSLHRASHDLAYLDCVVPY